MQRPSLTTLRQKDPVLEQTAEMQFSQMTQHKDPTRRVEHGMVATSRIEEKMWDVNNPGFKKRSAAGEIFNNPMYRTTENMSYPLIRLVQPKKTGYSTRFTSYRHLPLVKPSLDARVAQGKLDNLSDNAITDAFANVSANEGNTLLWLGEMKETIKMLSDIGKGLKMLHEKTADQRKKWAKGKLTVKETQSLTLAILYGILPLEQQIADFMEGLFETKQANSRNTARGFRVFTDTSSLQYNLTADVNAYSGAEYFAFSQEALSVTVRAGVLFEVDIEDTPWLSVILEPKAIVSTAYALARLSFVLSWFINVGGTLAAWSPSAGVKELSSWVTVTVEHDHVVKYVCHGKTQANPVSGEGEYKRSTTEKWRVPVTRADLPVFPPLDVNLDIEKVLAMVLLFAKIK